MQEPLLQRDLNLMIYRQSALYENNSRVLLQCNHSQYYYVIFYLDMISASRLYSHLPISYIVPMPLRKIWVSQWKNLYSE